MGIKIENCCYFQSKAYFLQHFIPSFTGIPLSSGGWKDLKGWFWTWWLGYCSPVFQCLQVSFSGTAEVCSKAKMWTQLSVFLVLMPAYETSTSPDGGAQPQHGCCCNALNKRSSLCPPPWSVFSVALLFWIETLQNKPRKVKLVVVCSKDSG